MAVGVTPGASTTEHWRAVRAEIAASLLAAVGLGLLVRQNMLGVVLLAVAGACYAGIAIAYSHHRTGVKRSEAEADAAKRVAELQTPRQRVV